MQKLCRSSGHSSGVAHSVQHQPTESAKVMHEKTSSILKTFLATTSLKGVSRAVKSDSVVLQLTWTAAVIFGISVATYFVYILVEAFTSGRKHMFKV